MKRQIILLVLAVLTPIVGGVIALRRAGDGTSPAARPVSVLVMGVTGLRSDALGCYGGTMAATPHMDRMAVEGVLCEQAITPCPLTAPAMTSLLTGLNPPAHGVRNDRLFELPEDPPTLPEGFARAGYATAAVIGGVELASERGFARGYRHYAEPRPRPDGGITETPGGDVTRQAIDWLMRHNDEPFFLCLQYVDPALSAAGDAAAKETYARQVEFIDSQLGEIVAVLEDLGRLEDTIVVLAGLCGEAFGEQGEQGHGGLAQSATLRVPLLLRGPELIAGSHVGTPVSLIDVASTVLDCGDQPVTRLGHGESIEPWQGAAPVARLLYVENLLPNLECAYATIQGLASARWLWLAGESPLLFDRENAEPRNVAAEHPDTLAALRAEYEARWPQWRDVSGAPNDALERNGDGAGARFGRFASAYVAQPRAGKASPWEHVEIMNQLRTASRAIVNGDAAPMELCRRVLEREPKNPMALRLSVMAGILAGDVDAALTGAAAWMKAWPEDAEAALAHGDVLERMSRHEEARASYEMAGRLNVPAPEVQWRVATSYLRQRMPERALEICRGVLRERPGDCRFLRVQMESLGALQQWQDLRSLASQCVAEYPELPDGYLWQAVAAWRLGFPAEALPVLLSGLRRAPEDARFFASLAQVYLELGRFSLARSYARLVLENRPEDEDMQQVLVEVDRRSDE